MSLRILPYHEGGEREEERWRRKRRKKRKKENKKDEVGHWWLIPEILATQEA
jgi:hypothetical protein